jgi:hypothetical protein
MIKKKKKKPIAEYIYMYIYVYIYSKKIIYFTWPKNFTLKKLVFEHFNCFRKCT